MVINTVFDKLHERFLSENTKTKSEHVILVIAIISFVVHLIIIGLVDFKIINVGSSAELFRNPIAAIYTPFSFILVYEVYLLIHYLPKSFTTYISKQYEIITLIIIRRLFKDLSSLSFTSDWFESKHDLQFTYDLVASVLLFFLIYIFYKQSKKREKAAVKEELIQDSISKFIMIKKRIATVLVPLLIGVAIYSFVSWVISVFSPNESGVTAFKNINNIFFEQFFTILIIADVLLLLFSFFHTDDFHKIIRNSGFIISTILIRLSFSASGLLNTLLICTAIIFGLLILMIHNKFETQIENSKAPTDTDTKL